MPQTIDFGETYGKVQFPDDWTDAQIAAEHDSWEAVRTRTPPPTPFDYAKQITGSAIRGFTDTLATIPEGAATLSQILARRVPGGFPALVAPGLALPARALEAAGVDLTAPATEVLRGEGRLLRRTGEFISPKPVPALEESFLATKVPSGVGSAAAFAAGGLAGLAVKAPAWLTVASLGSLSTGQQFYDDAKAKGADESTAEIASLLGNVVGTSEAIPIAGIVNRINRASGGTFLRTLLTAGTESFEEAVQNSAQQLAQNFTAQQLYDKDRDLFKDFREAATVGGATGFLVSTIASVLGVPIAARLRREQPTERKQYGQEEPTTVDQRRAAETRRAPTTAAPAGRGDILGGGPAQAIGGEATVTIGAAPPAAGIGGIVPATAPGIAGPVLAPAAATAVETGIPVPPAAPPPVGVPGAVTASEIGADVPSSVIGQNVTFTRQLTTTSEPVSATAKVLRIIRGPDTRGGSQTVEVIFDDGTSTGRNAGQQSDGSFIQWEQGIANAIAQKGKLQPQPTPPYAQAPRTETQAGGIPPPQLVAQAEAGVRVRNLAEDRLAAEQGAAVITEALRGYGVEPSPQVAVINDPTPEAPAARTVFDTQTNQFRRIELNQAKIRNAQEAGQYFEHEVSHTASDSGALADVMDSLTTEERTNIAAEMQRLGYPTGAKNEFDARGTDALVSAWRGRTWFGQLVGRITAWANERLGMRLTRRAAEAIAVRAVGESLAKLRGPVVRRPGLVLASNAFLTAPETTRAESALTAFHGTPHEVGRFTTARVGTGEGAQVYGWGLYFAENPEVSKVYAQRLGRATLQTTEDKVAEYLLRQNRYNQAAALEDLDLRYSHLYTPDQIANIRNKVESGNVEFAGNEYTVSLNVAPEELLDWDKPLNEQSEKAKAAFTRAGIRLLPIESAEFQSGRYNRPSGVVATTEPIGQWYTDLANGLGGIEEASRYLASLGIKGIRYLDQGSRKTPLKVIPVSGRAEFAVVEDTDDARLIQRGFKTRQEAQRFADAQKTYNYVIFDENDIQITHRNGQQVTPTQLAAQERAEEARVPPGEEYDDMAFARYLDSQKLSSSDIETFVNHLAQRQAPRELQKYFGDLLDWQRAREKLQAVTETVWEELRPARMQAMREARMEAQRLSDLSGLPSRDLFKDPRVVAIQEEANRRVAPYQDIFDDITQRFAGPNKGIITNLYDLMHLGGPFPSEGPYAAIPDLKRWVNELTSLYGRLHPQERAEEAKVEPVAVPIEGVRVAGAAAQLGRIAEDIYTQRESAGTALEGLAYERRQFKTAKAELRRLSEIATGRFFQDGLTVEDNPEVFPDPGEDITIVDGQLVVPDAFINKLTAAEVDFNPENVRAMQGEIFFEKESHRLVNLLTQIDVLQSAVMYYSQLGVEQSEIDKIAATINTLSAEAAKLGEAQWNGRTIGDRTNEIQSTEAARPSLIAQREALGLEPVAEFFGRQVGGFRGFIEKIRQALVVSVALRDKATSPEELRQAVEDAVGWLTLPEQVRDSIISGTSLTDEQRAAAFAGLASAFEDFGIQRSMMEALHGSRLLKISKDVRELLQKISSAKVSEGMAEVLIADVLAALDGEVGGTGTLQSQATVQELKGRLTAIRNFALNLGQNLETNGALFQWIANPTGPPPLVNAQMAQALGVDANTLAMILEEVKKNPQFGSAIVTLINSADKKLAKLPVVQLEQIQSLLQQGQPEAANAAAQKMIASANKRGSLAAASQRQNLRQLEALDIERQALEHGVAMFNELAASPEFTQLRDAVQNSPFGLVEPMDVANNTVRTLRPFGAKGIPSHEGVRLDAADSPVLKSEDFLRVFKWMTAAQEHLDAYDAAAGLYTADPANNPSPTSLGFDLPAIRGLRDATNRSVPGSAQELSTQSEGSRFKIPWLVRVMNKTAWFRQHNFVAKMVGGLVGTDLRAKLGDWINHFLISRSVTQQYRDIPQLRHAAMKSHPEVQLNTALYRKFWNEMAHWGRQFGSPVRVGFVLPQYGAAVTKEDMALLRRQREFEEDLRRKVVETTPVAGVRLQKGQRELVRAGAYVGDQGLPRWLNQHSNSFIADVVAAYSDPVGGFDIAADLSQTSADPVVRFWNEKIRMAIQHVRDSTRQDRGMRVGPLMAQAERTATADWLANGTPTIQSLDELVTELVKHFPAAPGLNIREQVVKGLNDELRQYRDAAKRIENERQERTTARNSKVQISFSADNEFTRPAANLDLPSELYDYGALSDADHMLIQSRANHERVVAYATALQRARAELHNRLERFRNGETSEKQAAFGGTVEELKQVLGILNKVYDDFDAAYKMGSPALTQSGWFREATGLLTSAVLALPTVNLRNMTQGQFEVYTMSRAMGLAGERMLFWRALLNMPKTLVRYALHIGSGIAKRTDLGGAFLTGKNLEIFTKLVDGIATIIGQGDFRASADRVHQLGFDTRDGFLQRMRRIWEASAESAQVEDLGKTKLRLLGEERRVGRLFGLPHNALRALFDTIGVQESDLTINSALLTYATWLEKRLGEVAINYGQERTRQGLTGFDPTNPAWQLKPDEWSSFINEQANKDSLGLFRLFLEGSVSAEGFQLEKNLLDYYQKLQAGQPVKLFTDRQFDALQRGLLAEFNASTPANRSSAAAGNNTIRNLLTLQGYVSDGLLKLINAFMGGSRDRTAISTIMAKLPMLTGLALMSVLIGYFVGALTGEWEKRLRGRMSSLPTPLDKDFWTSWKRWGDGTARLSLAQLFYLGDIVLAMRGEIQGNRGFDPVGRVFPISIIQRALNAIRGMWVTQGTVGDKLVPMADMGRSMVPWSLELENIFGTTVGAIKQGERIFRGEAQVRDLLPERRAQPFQGPSYGPTTVVRRNLSDAVSDFWERQQAGDAAGAAQALETAKAELKKLEGFYTAKYVKAGDTPERAAYKAQQDLWRDYQELNPVVAAMLGKRPTAAEYELIRSGITGDRAKAVDNAVAAWQAGARELFGRAAPVTREDVAASRGGGGAGRGSLGGIPSGFPRARAIPGGFPSRRRIGLRAVGGLRRVGISVRAPRLARARVSVPAARRRRVPAAGIRAPRLRRLGLRRLAGPRVSRIPTRPRRLGLGRRRSRRYAVA